jgi:hypothetical protein
MTRCHSVCGPQPVQGFLIDHSNAAYRLPVEGLDQSGRTVWSCRAPERNSVIGVLWEPCPATAVKLQYVSILRKVLFRNELCI